jgi:hypothetical protein
LADKGKDTEWKSYYWREQSLEVYNLLSELKNSMIENRVLFY